MIGGHKFDCLGRQQPYAVEFTTVKQHLAEPRVVLGRRHHPATSREPFGPVRKVIDDHDRPLPSRGVHLWLGNVGRLGLADREPGCGEIERLRDPLLHELVECRPGPHFNNASQDICRHAVFECRSRLVNERKLGKLGYHVGKRLVEIGKLGVLIGLPDPTAQFALAPLSHPSLPSFLPLPNGSCTSNKYAKPEV